MSTIYRTAIVPYSSQEMYLLVNDIEKYPEFLPWCLAAQILDAKKDRVEATLHVAKGMWQGSFTTVNQLLEQTIKMRLKNGPFKFLEGAWKFEDLATKGCQITFELRFEFMNFLLSLTAGPIFEQMTGSLVDAFTQRAHEIYAKESLN